MTNALIHPSTQSSTELEAPETGPGQSSVGARFDDEIARLIRDRVQADLTKRQDRRRRHRDGREALEKRRQYAKQALQAEKLAARAQQSCQCPQPRPPALLARDPGGGTSVLTLCPVCGRRT